MFCNQCGSEIKENSNFCNHCGNSISETSNKTIALKNDQVGKNNIFTEKIELEAPSIEKKIIPMKRIHTFGKIIFWILLIVIIMEMGNISLLMGEVSDFILAAFFVWIIIGTVILKVIKKKLTKLEALYSQATRNDQVRHEERIRIKERERQI